MALRVAQRWVQTASEDWLGDLSRLVRLVQGAKDYEQAMQIKDALDVFRDRLLARFKATAKSLQERYQGDEELGDMRDMLLSAGTEIFQLLELPIQEPALWGGEYAEDSDEEEEFAAFEDQVDDWVNDLQTAGVDALSVLEDGLAWEERFEEPTSEPVRREIEGFNTLLVGFDPKADAKAYGKIEVILRKYRRAVSRAFPRMLQWQLPFELRFDRAAGNWIGRLHRGRIQISVPKFLRASVPQAVHILAHEMGHWIYEKKLHTEAARAWAQLGEGISLYGKTSPEEAFPEAIGYLVAYGPRSLPERAMQWLRGVLPGVRLARVLVAKLICPQCGSKEIYLDSDGAECERCGHDFQPEEDTSKAPLTYVKDGIYLAPLKLDRFIHFTTLSRANQVMEAGKLLMKPPYQKFGPDEVYAVSTIFGTYLPGVQFTHTRSKNKGSDPIVAIVFRTPTVPKGAHVEEVYWDRDVVLRDAKIVPLSAGRSLIQKSPVKLSDREFVVYDLRRL